jgi:hypothetical protein
MVTTKVGDEVDVGVGISGNVSVIFLGITAMVERIGVGVWLGSFSYSGISA